jgi:UDP-N-acetylmuramyl pentapeptide phosphotransferase/UDP-N-acetylglucosamine-1-phosphate transferase
MMSAPLMLTALVILTGIISALLSWVLIRFNARLHLTAAPRHDRWHRRATPNSGGIAIFLSCAAAYGLAFRGAYSIVAAGTAAICLLGFLDDRFRISPALKLAAQCAIAAVVVHGGVVFSATSWAWINYAFSFLWIVGITNSFNLIDNMAGRELPGPRRSRTPPPTAWARGLAAIVVPMSNRGRAAAIVAPKPGCSSSQ